MAGGEHKGLPGIVHNGLGAQAPGAHFGAELLHQRVGAVLQGRRVPLQQSLRLGPGEPGLLLGTQAAQLTLFLQHQVGVVAVIAAEAELFPAADTV